MKWEVREREVEYEYLPRRLGIERHDAERRDFEDRMGQGNDFFLLDQNRLFKGLPSQNWDSELQM